MHMFDRILVGSQCSHCASEKLKGSIAKGMLQTISLSMSNSGDIRVHMY